MVQLRARRRWALAVTLVLASGFAAIDPAAAIGPVRAPSAEVEVEVDVVDFAFNPETLEVAIGTTVVFTNRGAAPHTATSDDGAFDSGRIDSGASFSLTFDAPGTYAYHCEFHPNMRATITVVQGEDGEDDPTAPADETASPATTRLDPTPPAGGLADDADDEGNGAAQVPPLAVPHLAHIHAGTCNELGIVVFSLANVRAYALDRAPEQGPVQVTMGTAEVALTELFAEPFSIHVHQSDADKQRYIACAEVGTAPPPPPWEPTDGLALEMQEQADSGESGIVSLRPDTGGATTVTLLLAGGATTSAEETPEPTGGDETPEPTGDDETPTVSRPGNYASPTFGYTLGYGTTWTVEDESSTGRQDRLVLSNGTSFVSFVAAAGFGGDPAECVSGFAEEQLVDPAVSEVTAATDEVGNPLRGGTEATGSFAVYNHLYALPDGQVEPYTLFIGCIPLVAGEAVLAVIHNVPTADYNTEVEAREGLLRGLTLPQG